MQYLFSRWDEFEYGKTCQTHAGKVLRGLLDARKAANQTKRVIKIGAASIVITAALVVGGSQGTLNAPNMAIGKRAIRMSELSQRVKSARDTMRLTQQEASDFLHLPLRTLQSLESSETENPNTTTMEKYNLLLELSDYLKMVLGNRKFAITSSLRTPLIVFGNISALAYGKKVADGADFVLSTFRRMYG